MHYQKLTYHETLSPLKVVCNDLVVSGNCNTGGYRYGFNSMERDNEIKGKGNSYDFGARMYDPRVGRWLSLDKLSKKHPSEAPYCMLYIIPQQEKTKFLKTKWQCREFQHWSL